MQQKFEVTIDCDDEIGEAEIGVPIMDALLLETIRVVKVDIDTVTDKPASRSHKLPPLR